MPPKDLDELITLTEETLIKEIIETNTILHELFDKHLKMPGEPDCRIMINVLDKDRPNLAQEFAEALENAGAAVRAYKRMKQ